MGHGTSSFITDCEETTRKRLYSAKGSAIETQQYAETIKLDASPAELFKYLSLAFQKVSGSI
jgi:hypothetical protein